MNVICDIFLTVVNMQMMTVICCHKIVINCHAKTYCIATIFKNCHGRTFHHSQYDDCK